MIRVGAVVCSFSGGLGAMRRRDQGDTVAVLRVLRDNPLFSVWDAGETMIIARTMSRLIERGFITVADEGYPWSRATITEAGLALMGGAA